MNPSSTEGEAGPRPTNEGPSQTGETAESIARAMQSSEGAPAPVPPHPAPIPGKKLPMGNPRAFDRFRGGSRFHGGKGGSGAPNYLRQHMKHGRGS
jgi:hypothetical protein